MLLHGAARADVAPSKPAEETPAAEQADNTAEPAATGDQAVEPQADGEAKSSGCSVSAPQGAPVGAGGAAWLLLALGAIVRRERA